MMEQKTLQYFESKYVDAFRLADQWGIHLQNMRVQNGILSFKGVAPSFEARDKFWSKVKDADPLHDDMEGDIKVYLTQYSGTPVLRLQRTGRRFSEPYSLPAAA